MNKELQTSNSIRDNIYTIRNIQVMIDRDLAKMYGVETRRLNEQVKRNIDRFPAEFMFQLTKEEMNNWKSQIATSNKEIMGLRKPPLAFTEQGVSMLSAILRSKIAIDVSIKIINAFVSMRKFILYNENVFQRINNLEQKQIAIDIQQGKTDNKVNEILNALENKSATINEGIYYDGQIFDAYSFISKLIKTANKSIVLIDAYVDDTTLLILSKRNKNVKAEIFTAKITKQFQLDIEKYNTQYPEIVVKTYKKSHDRFLIIDNKTLYHIGASLKDLGKKWFAFSKMGLDINDVLKRLND